MVTSLPDEGFLNGSRFVIMDRDQKYSDAFRGLLEDAGIEPVRLPPRSPNLNAYAERCVRSVKDECLGKVILFGERSLRRALKQYDAHYHSERNHQVLQPARWSAPVLLPCRGLSSMGHPSEKMDITGFEQDEQGQITGATIYQPGAAVDAEHIEE